MTAVQDITHLQWSPLTWGMVFSVTAKPFFDWKGNCTYFELCLIEDEGYGTLYELTVPYNQVDSIPVQVELLLMELNCAPTWFWHYTNAEYHCQFANATNKKCVDDAGAHKFPVLKGQDYNE